MSSIKSEDEFLDVIGTKVFRVFFLAIQSHLTYGFYSPHPLSKRGLKLVCNVNILYRNLKITPETSSKVFVHEFGFSFKI
jgi:hypothetical protein